MNDDDVKRKKIKLNDVCINNKAELLEAVNKDLKNFKQLPDDLKDDSEVMKAVLR